MMTNPVETGSTNWVGAQLRSLRTARGLSLGALALRAGVHKATLSRWETGVQQPGIPELEATLAALDATPADRQEALHHLSASGAPRAVQLLKKERRNETTHSPLSSLAEMPPGGGDLLRVLRLRRGWHQEQVAAKLGFHLSSVSRWERGEGWPEPERLHELCVALGATPEETAALSAGHLITETNLDALEHWFRSDITPVHMFGEMYVNMDLPFFRLEASLWTHATRRVSVRSLLGEVYAHHANYLRNRRRFSEVGAYAEKALTIAQTEVSQQRVRRYPEWAELAAVCAADAAAKQRQPRPERGAEILQWWLKRHNVSLIQSSWMYRKLAGYFSAQERFSEAIEAVQVAVRLTEKLTEQATDSPDSIASSRLENHRYMASTMLAMGRPEEALRWLLQEQESYPPNRFRDAMLWSEAHLRVGQRSQAQDWCGRAYAEINAHGLVHRLPAVERIATLL